MAGPSLARLILKTGNVTGGSLAHRAVPFSPIKGDKQVQTPRGQRHRKAVTTGEEEFQQAHVCDVKQGDVAPGGLKRFRTWCKHTLPMTARQKNAFLSGSPKQDVARGLLTVTPSQEAASLITTSNPGMAGHPLKRADWTPAGDVCQGHTPFLSAKGSAPSSLHGACHQ